LALHNRQRGGPVNMRLLRQIVRTLLLDLLRAEKFDLGIYLVGTEQITRLNETFLHHRGATDVIAFDYSEPDLSSTSSRNRLPMKTGGPGLCGEVFVCPDMARSQARRFRTSWPRELVRYIVHGILHLGGHDDLETRARREMRREEARLFRNLAGHFSIEGLAGAARRRPGAPHRRRRSTTIRPPAQRRASTTGSR
jgi:probable rRNA maturation factor